MTSIIMPKVFDPNKTYPVWIGSTLREVPGNQMQALQVQQARNAESFEVRLDRVERSLKAAGLLLKDL
jgi:hypothetical protein